MRNLLETLTGLAIIYAVTAFVAGDINPLNWHWAARLIYIIWSIYAFVKFISK